MKYGNKHHSNLEQTREHRVRQSNAHATNEESFWTAKLFGEST